MCVCPHTYSICECLSVYYVCIETDTQTDKETARARERERERASERASERARKRASERERERERAQTNTVGGVLGKNSVTDEFGHRNLNYTYIRTHSQI